VRKATDEDDDTDFRSETSSLPHQPTHNNSVPSASANV
jgi:hypothetical protein